MAVVSRRLMGLFVLMIFLTSRVLAADKNDSPLTQDQLFDGQSLLDVQITVDENDWKKLSAQSLNFVSAFGKGSFKSTYSYFSGDLSINGRQLPGVEIRKKGFFGSMDQDRPSLKVRIEKPDQNKLVGGLDRLTLNNNKQDRSCASQFIAYRLFHEAGLPAPRCSLVRLTVNGKSLGVYSHVESIDEHFLQRTFGSDKGDLVEGVFPTDFVSDRLERFDLKTNKQNNARSDLRHLAEILEKADDPQLVAQLEKIFDLDEFIKYWALESLIGFWDGYASNQNNYYLYKDPKDSKLHFIPWGADMTLVPPFFPGGGAAKKSVYAKGLLAFRLNQDAGIRQRYHAALLNLLDTVWREDELIKEVDRVESLIKGELHAAQAGIEQSAEATRNFIRNRRNEIMEEVKEGPMHITTPPAKPFYMREAGQASATFSAAWTAGNGKRQESEQATVELVLDGQPVKFTRVVATAGPSPFAAFGAAPGRPAAVPPTVALIGERESDKKKMTLTITFGPDQFGPTERDSIDVQGMMMEGETFAFGAGMRSFIGKAELKSASQENGAKISGSLKGRLFEMRGGFGG